MDFGDSGNFYVSTAITAVGSYYGYGGVLVASLVNYALFSPKEADDGLPFNSLERETNILSKLDRVPFIIGTDIVPGQVTYLNEISIKHALFYGGDFDYWEQKTFKTFREGGNKIEYMHGDFVVNFTQNYYDSSNNAANVINQVWYDDFHQWDLMKLSDTYVNSIHSSPSSANTIQSTSWHPPKTRYQYQHEMSCYLRYWGIFGSPMHNSMYHASRENYKTDNQQADVDTRGVKWIQFPNVSAEITSSKAPYSTFAFSRANKHFIDCEHGYRDGMSEYFYGIHTTGTSGSNQYRIFKKDPYTQQFSYPISKEEQDTTITKLWNNDMVMSRQDLANPDRLYFFVGRNWRNPYNVHGVVGQWDHHHANYTLEYDIFYIDRSDDSVHSVIYNQQISIPSRSHGHNSIPSFRMDSFEVTNDKIIGFGMLYQSECPWGDLRQIEDHEDNSSSKIYMDLTAYPAGFWGGKWAWISGQSSEKRTITSQTQEYITVQGAFGQSYDTNSIMYLDIIRTDQSDWAVILEGSTRNVIYCSFFPNSLSFSGGETILDMVKVHTYCGIGPGYLFRDHHYDSCWVGGMGKLSGDNNIGSRIGSTIYLSRPLTSDPVVGQPVWFGLSTNKLVRLRDDKFYTEAPNPFKIDDRVPSTLMTDANGNLPPNWYIHYGLQNRSGFGKVMALSFCKSTGEYQGAMFVHNTPGYRYTGIQGIFVVESFSVSSVSTDAEIWATINYAQPYTYQFNCSFLIDKETYVVRRSRGFGRNRSASSHVGGIIYRGAVKVWMYDWISKQQCWRWVALAQQFDNIETWKKWHSSIYIYINSTKQDHRGTYVICLGKDARFVDFPITSHELNEETTQVQKHIPPELFHETTDKFVMHVFYGTNTGPLYFGSAFVSSWSTRTDSPALQLCDYDQKIFCYFNRGGYHRGSPGTSAMDDLWCIYAPNESNKNGFGFLIKNGLHPNWAMLQWGLWPSILFQSTKYTISNKYGHYSNYCDENPVQAVQRLLNLINSNNNTLPKVVTLNADYVEPIAIASELISAKINYCDRKFDIREPRFQFSKMYDQTRPIKDIVSEILSTCQGFLQVGCGNHIKVKLPTQNETAIYYFGIDEADFTSNALSDNRRRIYADFSNYPIDYWKGDIGWITLNNVETEFVVVEQTLTYIDCGVNLAIFVPSGVSFTIKKDNIKQGTFTFWRKAQNEKSNLIRIEFKNRLLGYINDVVEVEDKYRIDVLDKHKKIRQFEMNGIKRATQAARMALRLLDYENYVNWMSGFVVDLIGYHVCVGDVIGLSHPVTGWDKKLFRVIKMEEVDDDFKIECEEYISDIYHDEGQEVFQCGSSSHRQSYDGESTAPIRTFAYHDINQGKIYVGINFPEDERIFAGCSIYITHATYQWWISLDACSTLQIRTRGWKQIPIAWNPSNAWALDMLCWAPDYGVSAHNDIPFRITDMQGFFLGWDEDSAEEIGVCNTFMVSAFVKHFPEFEGSINYKFTEWYKMRYLAAVERRTIHISEDPYKDYIEIDPETIMGGSFTQSGYLWYKRELIYYHSFDGSKFRNLVRNLNAKQYYMFEYGFKGDSHFIFDTVDAHQNYPLIVQADYNLFSFNVQEEWLDKDIKITATSSVDGIYGQSYRSGNYFIHIYGDKGRPRSPALIRKEFLPAD